MLCLWHEEPRLQKAYTNRHDKTVQVTSDQDKIGHFNTTGGDGFGLDVPYHNLRPGRATLEDGAVQSVGQDLGREHGCELERLH